VHTCCWQAPHGPSAEPTMSVTKSPSATIHWRTCCRQQYVRHIHSTSVRLFRRTCCHQWCVRQRREPFPQLSACTQLARPLLPRSRPPRQLGEPEQETTSIKQYQASANVTRHTFQAYDTDKRPLRNNSIFIVRNLNLATSQGYSPDNF